MQFVFLLSLLAVYGQLVLAVRERRQVPACEDISGIPESCRLLLDSSLYIQAYIDPTAFVDNYCNDTCAQPLYDYFRTCDKATGSSNATTFDFFCSTNSIGHHCLPALLANTSFIDACTLELEFCDDQCETALETARYTLGCCLDSYYAVLSGPTAAATIFLFCGLSGPDFCTGGVTEEPLKFFVVPEVDSRCEDLVDAVPEFCRYLISPTFQVDGFGYLDLFCDDTYCSPYVYDFAVGCDDRTGQYNSTFMDFYCARNEANKRCGDVLYVSSNPFELCDDFDGTSPSTCCSALAQAQTDLGCCLITYIQLVSETPGVNPLFSLCGLEGGNTCFGRFTDQLILPPSDSNDDCNLLQQGLPPQCLGVVSLDTLISQATVDPDMFRTNFCNSECGEAVYYYHLRCDRISGSRIAAMVDFLCAQNDDGATCAGIISDPSVQVVYSPMCADVSDTFCSDQCSTVLQEPSRTWGCCLFTLTAFDDDITYIEGIVEQCKLPEDQAHVCDGAFSGEPVAVPGVETTCDMLTRAIPDHCIQYLSDITTLASSNPDEILSGFCKSECANQLYNYFSKCYIQEGAGKTTAAYLDLFCSEDRGGADCVKMLTDSNFQSTFENECATLETAPVCSPECSRSFVELSDDWGCCFYSFTSLESNVTYSDLVWSQCGARIPGLCQGALSGSTIDAPGSDGVAANVVSSLMPVIALLTLTLTLY